MKMRVLLAGVAVFALALPFGLASAAPCNDVQVLSGRFGFGVDPGTAGCAASTNSDLVLAGSNQLSVRYVGAGDAIGGTLSFGALADCTAASCVQPCSGGVCTLDFQKVNVLGTVVWQTLPMTINGSVASVNGGTATANITVCTAYTYDATLGQDVCSSSFNTSRTYNTVL